MKTFVKAIPHLYAEQSLYRAMYWRGVKDQEREAKAFAQCVADRFFLDPQPVIRILEVLAGTRLHKDLILNELHTLMPGVDIIYTQGDAIDGDSTDFVTGKGPAVEGCEYDVIVGFFMSFNSFLDIERGYKAGSLPTIHALANFKDLLSNTPGAFIWLDFCAYGSESGISSVLESRSGGMIKPGPQQWQTTCTTHKLDIFRNLLRRYVDIKAVFGIDVTPENQETVEHVLAKTLTIAVACSSEFDRRSGVVSDRYLRLELYSSACPRSPLVEWRVEHPFEIMYTSEVHASILAQTAGFSVENINFGEIDRDNKFRMQPAVLDQSDRGVIKTLSSLPKAKPETWTTHDIFSRTVPDVLILTKGSPEPEEYA